MENAQSSGLILVTGAAGLLGSHLVEKLLENGKSVRALYNNNFNETLVHPNLQKLKVDILDILALEDAMQGVEEIYHCAGVVSFLGKDELRLYKINVDGTSNIVNIALALGVKKLVHVSSVAALGRIRNNVIIDETMHWSAQTSNSKYGHSKYLGEMEVWRAIAEGLNAVIVNPVIILGAGNWDEGSTKIFKSVYKEFPWYTNGVTGFVDVADVVKAMILLMESKISAEKFILSAENETYQNLFNQIADAFEKKHPYKKVSPILAKIVWRIEKLKSFFSGKPPLITKETTATAMAKSYFNNEKLISALPTFQYTPLKESIVNICNSLKQNMK